MNFKLMFFATFALFFMLQSCKTKQPMTDTNTTTETMPVDDSWKEQAQDFITNKTWELVEINGEKVSNTGNMKQAYIMFTRDDTRLSGNASCNTITGSYELKKGNKIEIGNVAATKMACPDMNVEQELLKVLDIVDNYSVGANSLSLHSGRLTSLAKFKVAN